MNGTQQQLVRRFIGKRLAEYYAQPADRVVGSARGIHKVNLSSLWGEAHWRRVLQRLYDERNGHWLTPVELFKPHYSNILSNFICRQAEYSTEGSSCSEEHIEIVELGGGRGTNCNLILSRLREVNEGLYSKVKYTLVDSSPTLHEFQRKELSSSGHSEKVNFKLCDLMDVAEEKMDLLENSDAMTIVIALEVLDNLPHDVVRRSPKFGDDRLEQAVINHPRDDTTCRQKNCFDEVFIPLSDPLISRVVGVVPSYVMQQSPSFVPTVACGVLEHLIKQRRNLRLVMADFNWLPPPDISNATLDFTHGQPLVTSMDGVDHESYLRSPPMCDILFPTDFDKLASFVKRAIALSRPEQRRARHSDPKASDKVVTVETQAEFLQRYGHNEVRGTRSWLTGYTPLLHDFTNCSVLSVTNKNNS